MSKPYVRQGRKFVPVPDCTGYFYGKDGLHKEKTPYSYAIVVSQDADIATLAFFHHSPVKLTWEEAKEYCHKRGMNLYMPSLIEALQAVKFKEHLCFELGNSEWMSTEVSTNYTWTLHWGLLDPVIAGHKSNSRYVRPFFKLNVLTGEYV